MKGKRSGALSDKQIDAILEDMMRGDLNLGEAEETLERLQAVRSRVVPKLVAMLQRLALRACRRSGDAASRTRSEPSQ